jgi:hypothetical protein
MKIFRKYPSYVGTYDRGIVAVKYVIQRKGWFGWSDVSPNISEPEADAMLAALKKAGEKILEGNP